MQNILSLDSKVLSFISRRHDTNYNDIILHDDDTQHNNTHCAEFLWTVVCCNVECRNLTQIRGEGGNAKPYLRVRSRSATCHFHWEQGYKKEGKIQQKLSTEATCSSSADGPCGLIKF